MSQAVSHGGYQGLKGLGWPLEDLLANFTLEKWGRSLCRWGQPWRAIRHSLQWLVGLTQLGRGSLVERRNWVGEISRNHISRYDFHDEKAKV